MVCYLLWIVRKKERGGESGIVGMCGVTEMNEQTKVTSCQNDIGYALKRNEITYSSIDLHTYSIHITALQ